MGFVKILVLPFLNLTNKQTPSLVDPPRSIIVSVNARTNARSKAHKAHSTPENISIKICVITSIF